MDDTQKQRRSRCLMMGSAFIAAVKKKKWGQQKRWGYHAIALSNNLDVIERLNSSSVNSHIDVSATVSAGASFNTGPTCEKRAARKTPSTGKKRNFSRDGKGKGKPKVKKGRFQPRGVPAGESEADEEERDAEEVEEEDEDAEEEEEEHDEEEVERAEEEEAEEEEAEEIDEDVSDDDYVDE